MSVPPNLDDLSMAEVAKLPPSFRQSHGADYPISLASATAAEEALAAAHELPYDISGLSEDQIFNLLDLASTSEPHGQGDALGAALAVRLKELKSVKDLVRDLEDQHYLTPNLLGLLVLKELRIAGKDPASTIPEADMREALKEITRLYRQDEIDALAGGDSGSRAGGHTRRLVHQSAAGSEGWVPARSTRQRMSGNPKDDTGRDPWRPKYGSNDPVATEGRLRSQTDYLWSIAELRACTRHGPTPKTLRWRRAVLARAVAKLRQGNRTSRCTPAALAAALDCSPDTIEELVREAHQS